MTSALQCNGHSVFLMVKKCWFVLQIQLNSLNQLFSTYYDIKYVSIRNMTLELTHHVYILFSVVEYVRARVKKHVLNETKTTEN